MFVIYENATGNDEPLNRGFVFDKRTHVRYNGKTQIVESGKQINLKVKRKTKVFASNQPKSINYKG